MFDARHDLDLGSGITLQFVSNQNPWRVAQALEQLTKEPFDGMPVAPALHRNIECMAVLIDGAP
jgi:PIN domain nuclease of toxin-antitoxin system